MNFEDRRKLVEAQRVRDNKSVIRSYRLKTKPTVDQSSVDKVRAILGTITNRMSHMDFDLMDALVCSNEAQEVLIARARGDLSKCRDEIQQIARILGV